MLASPSKKADGTLPSTSQPKRLLRRGASLVPGLNATFSPVAFGSGLAAQPMEANTCLFKKYALNDIGILHVILGILAYITGRVKSKGEPRIRE